MYHYIVIDDEELTRMGTIAKLKEMNHLISCIAQANDGQEALAFIEQYNPDIIITDMNMPNMDGSGLLPILTDRYPDKPIIVISGYKDFEYTKHAIQANAIDYLLKPFGSNEIQHSMEHAISILQNKVKVQNQIIDSETERERACYEYDIQSLKNTILGFHTEKFKLTSKKLSYMNHAYQLLLMTLHTKELLSEEAIQNYLAENGFGDLALYLQHIDNKHLGFLILFVPEQSVLTSEALSHQVARGILNFFGSVQLPISIGISSTHNKLTQLHDAFLETVNALNTKKVKDTHQFYRSHPIEAAPMIFKWEKEDELLFRIEAGMTDEVSSLVCELFSSFQAMPDISYSDIKFYCFHLSDQTRTILANYIEQIPPDSVSSSTQNILNTMFDLDELQSYYHQSFANITKMLHQKGIYAAADVIEKMRIYTKKNYMKNLTVELLSSYLYMSRSYLSHLFKEKTGEKYVDYLNDIRLDKAKELLRSSDKKMYQIAKSVGYDNIKYFFRVFKKKTGMTPEQWRNHDS